MLQAVLLTYAWHAGLQQQIACITAVLPPILCVFPHAVPHPACRARRVCLTATAPETSSGASGTRSSSSSSTRLTARRCVQCPTCCACVMAPPHLRTLSLQSLRKFKMLVAAVIFTCMAVHVLCFALIMDGIHVSSFANEMVACCNQCDRAAQMSCTHRPCA